MSWSWYEQSWSQRGLTRWRVLTVTAALAAVSCARDHDTIAEEQSVDVELAALMEDGVLPSTMKGGTTTPVAPPRFCGGSFPGDADAGVEMPPPKPGAGIPLQPPPLVAASVAGRAGSAGGPADAGDVGGNAVDPACASVPIGFWRFDDCNTSRTDLGDSTFQGHTAFRTVDLTCGTGREGLAPEFKNEEDLVYVPDQPDFALDFGVTVAAWVKPQAIDRVRTLFRKRDDGNSSLALMLNGKKFQFVVRLASGRMVSVSAPANAGKWTHVAATYDKTWVRLYLDGMEVSRAEAPGTIARGVGPLLMGNDASGRRFEGLMDNAWFNTMAAPAATIAKLTCVRIDPIVSVSPASSPAVTAGTAVTYTLSVNNPNEPRCDSGSFFVSANADDPGFTLDPSFTQIAPISGGQTAQVPIVVTSSEETEPGSYKLNFQVISNDGFFGGPTIPVSSAPPPIAVAATPGAARVAPPPGGSAAPPPTMPPGFMGFVQVSAQYVVSEPIGCHVSSQRELMIRHVSVVDDPVRTAFGGADDNPNTGAWSFGRLMQRLSAKDADAPDVTEAMLRTFLTPQTINSFQIQTRPPMADLVLSPWPRTANGKLDLARAPVRLLAITHRLDLKDLPRGKAGEGRLTYGVLDPSGNPMEFTIIFEYLLPARTEAEVRAWAEDVHALQALPFPSESYNQALQALTDRFSGRGAIPGAPNGSALIDIRTNEIALSQDGQWQLREFHISPSTGFMEPATVFQTPDASFNNSEALGRFINQNEAAILSETHEAPLRFEDMPFNGASIFNNIDIWSAPGVTNPEARHKFSLNTCNGCHGGETQTPFLQINPRVPGEQSRLSGFLTGETVFDPLTGQSRRLAELARRRQLLESVVCADQ